MDKIVMDKISDELRKWCESYAISLKDRWTVSADSGFAEEPSLVTHTRPDSWERMADELDEMVDAADSADDRCEKLADLAVRIRKLAKKEGER